MDEIAEIKRDIVALQAEVSAQSAVLAGLIHTLLRSGIAPQPVLEEGFEIALSAATSAAIVFGPRVSSDITGGSIAIIESIRSAAFGN